MLEGVTVFDGYGNYLLVQFPDADAIVQKHYGITGLFCAARRVEELHSDQCWQP